MKRLNNYLGLLFILLACNNYLFAILHLFDNVQENEQTRKAVLTIAFFTTSLIFALIGRYFLNKK